MQEWEFWLLDLDGTLVGVEWDYVRETIDRVGDRLGHEFSTAQTEAVWYSLRGDPDRKLREWGVDPDRFWTAFHEEHDPRSRAEAAFLYDDAEFVGEIGRPVGLVTHCQRYLTEPVLAELGIDDWFDAVVCCTDRTGWKPDPAPVHSAMSALGVTSDRDGVLAGDAAHDVGAAWNAGLEAVHVERHGPERRGACVLADHRVTGFDELWEPGGRRAPDGSD